eukprot:scaffold121865_cov72-Cyclotella_meneghiniana.AAC.6
MSNRDGNPLNQSSTSSKVSSSTKSSSSTSKSTDDKRKRRRRTQILSEYDEMSLRRMSLGMSSEKKETRRSSLNDLENHGDVELSSMVSCVDELCGKYGAAICCNFNRVVCLTY